MEQGITKIRIDGRWELEDFGVFSKQYTQCYSLLYSLSGVSEESELARRGFQFEYARYPWRGGYSVVNFYYSLYAQIPYDHRPEVKSIRYSSPGAIELSAILEVTATLGGIITITAISINKIHDLYNNIQRGIRERKLGRIEVEAKQLQLDREQAEYVTRAIKQIAEAMCLSDELMAALKQRTSGNKLVQLKVLLSLYRRMEPIAELVSRDMVNFRQNGNDEQLS